MTAAETKLWRHLRAQQLLGAHFRKQHAVDHFIVDFVCARANLVVEVDGDTHAERADYDAERTRWLETQHHYRVLRFTNDEVLHHTDAVLAAIAAALANPPPA